MISLQLYTTGDYPEPYMTASFNPEWYPPVVPLLKSRNAMAVKDWSENKGIEQALLDNNVLIESIGTVDAGYCKGNIYKVNKEFLGEI